MRGWVSGFIAGAATWTLASAQAPPAPGPAFSVVERTIPDLQDAMVRGRVTSQQLVEQYLARIRQYDRQGPQLNAFIALNPHALETAGALDAERRAGRWRGAAPRHPDRDQGQLRDRRHAHHRRVEGARRLRAEARRVRGEEAARRRRGHRRQDQPARARVRHHDGQLARRADAQPVRPDAQPRRIERRDGRGRRRQPRRGGPRHRHLRVGPHPGGAQQPLGPARHDRSLEPRRHHPARALAGHRRPHRAQRHRSRC